jgi:hypothetical protein
MRYPGHRGLAERDCQIQNSTRNHISQWTFDSNIRKRACQNDMLMLESAR